LGLGRSKEARRDDPRDITERSEAESTELCQRGAAALNRAGIATLEIDQWGGRGLPGGASSRPRNLTDNLPDVAGAYRLLAARSDINADSIGLMGSSMRRC